MNTFQSDIKIYTYKFSSNPMIIVNFFTFVHELLDNPSYMEKDVTYVHLMEDNLQGMAKVREDIYEYI